MSTIKEVGNRKVEVGVRCKKEEFKCTKCADWNPTSKNLVSNFISYFQLPPSFFKYISSSLGLTLVELLIGLTTAGIVGVLLISLLTQNSRIFSNQNAKLTEGITLNNSSARIADSIKSSSGIVTQYPVNGAAEYTTGTTAIVMTVPSLSAQGSVIKDTYDYQIIAADPQNSKILRLKLIPDALSSRKAKNEVLATNLSLLELSYYDINGQLITPIQAVKIGYIINVNQIVNAENQSSSASGEVNLRNN